MTRTVVIHTVPPIARRRCARPTTPVDKRWADARGHTAFPARRDIQEHDLLGSRTDQSETGMTSSSAINHQETVSHLVAGLLAAKSVPRTFMPDEQLSDVGLSSLDMVNLMLALEAEFDIVIPQQDMTPENFRTVASIGSMMTRLLPGAEPS